MNILKNSPFRKQDYWSDNWGYESDYPFKIKMYDVVGLIAIFAFIGLMIIIL